MRKLLALLLALVFLAAACGSDEDDPEEALSEEAASCETSDLPVKNEGRLTVGTDSPAFPPWFEEDDPTNGEGFESAVAYAVAGELGFAEEEVDWITVPFNSSYAPGEKDFDFDVNQISITEEREEAVDFSRGYYDVNQALVALADSALADIEGLDDLGDAKLGAQVGTTSLDFITGTIDPSEEPFVYDTTNDAKSALENGQIDGIVVDLPTAFFITAVEIEGAEVVGRFESDEAEQFGLLFEDGNPLRSCVDEALDRLDEAGMLDELRGQYLSQETDAPLID